MLVTMLFMGLLALTSTSLTVRGLQRTDRDTRRAQEALQSMIEEVRGRSRQAADDPLGWSAGLANVLGAGGALGAAFAVPGLQAVPGEAGALTVQLVTDETQDDAALGVRLGMPRDLNADGDAVDADVTADARLLPVIVRVRWNNGQGLRDHAQGLFLSVVQ